MERYFEMKFYLTVISIILTAVLLLIAIIQAIIGQIRAQRFYKKINKIQKEKDKSDIKTR